MESIYKLSVIINMIDSLTNPMKKMATESSNSLDKLTAKFATVTGAGAGLTALGASITDFSLNTVESTFESQDALGELKSLGIEDLSAVEDAAKNFSDTWGGTVKSDFISAAYDIKSGISSLSDEGVAKYTELAALTGKATKSSVDEMTSLFATGYNIYKGNYDDMSDLEFGEMFSAGIATAVQVYKTKGSEMSAAISSLGASASSAQVPLEEQLSILGMLQATMSGSEAGTKYQSFISAAASAGDTLKLSFTDANNQLLSMPEILAKLKGKYGDTIDAMEKQELASAFGTDEAVDVIDLLYGKTDNLQSNILSMYDSLGKGTSVATDMATAINSTDSQKYQVLKQRLQNIKEEIGTSLIPTINDFMSKAGSMLSKVSDWISKNQDTVTSIMKVVLILGSVLTVLGPVVAFIGIFGMTITKTIGILGSFWGALTKIPDILTTIRIKSMYAGDGIKGAFTKIGSAGKSAITAIGNVSKSVFDFAKTAAINGISAAKNFVVSLAGMAKQAITTAVTAMPGLIASVWSFTAALLANPITWVVIAIVGLIAGIVLLYTKCEWFRNGVNAILGSIKQKVGEALGVVQNIFGAIGSTIGNVMSAAKDTVKEKLDNMKTAYQENGGGIRGIAAAAVEGVKGYYTAGFTFLDNLTGGKLTDIKNKFFDKFEGIKNTVSTAMEGAKQYAAQKLIGMQAVYAAHGGGIKGTAAATMAGLKSVYQDAFNFLDTMTGGKLSSIRDKVSQGIEKVKNVITNALGWFRQSGSKIMSTFTEGIKNTISQPVDAVKSGLQKIRKLLPFSDAKEGPLSTLTLSGKRVFETINTGMNKTVELPAQTANKAFGKVASEITKTSGTGTKKGGKEVKLSKSDNGTSKSTDQGSSKDNTTVIQKLELTVDITKLKDLPLLFKLIDEIKNANNGTDIEYTTT